LAVLSLIVLVTIDWYYWGYLTRFLETLVTDVRKAPLPQQIGLGLALLGLCLTLWW